MEAEQIARNDAGIIAYLKSNLDVRLSAAFSAHHTCWLVEVIKGNKEVEFVSISDKTGTILEIEINSQPTTSQIECKNLQRGNHQGISNHVLLLVAKLNVSYNI